MDSAFTTCMATTTMVEESKHQQDLQPTVSCLVQHDVLKITLNGPALAFTILMIIISIQMLQPSFTCTLLALVMDFFTVNSLTACSKAPTPWIIYNDYRNFISLGPGGTPSTFLGYLKIAFLRMFTLSDPYTPPSADKGYTLSACYQPTETWLPTRSGPRPTIAGIAPQRQIDQPGDRKVYLELRRALNNLAAQNPDLFETKVSCFEKKGLALFAKYPINETCRGEVCHVHDSDQSMHMNLHPEDAKVVLEKGWGERHPLARGGWFKQYVPREFMMIYAPRNRAELETVYRIIEAAGYWSSGDKFKLGH